MELVFLLAAGSFCSQWCGDKKDHQMEMRWCLIAFKPLCCFLLFCVCVVARRMMSKWQRSYQGRCTRRKSRRAMAEGCVVVKISNVFLVFCSREVVRVGFLDLSLKGKYKRIHCAMYFGRQSF